MAALLNVMMSQRKSFIPDLFEFVFILIIFFLV